MLETQEKSILDHVEVRDDAFPLGKDGPEEKAADAGTPAEVAVADPAVGDEGTIGDLAESLVGRLAQAADDVADGKLQSWTARCVVADKAPGRLRNLLPQVGNCPTCDFPIYGNTAIEPGQKPTIQRSCECFQTKGETVAAKKTPKAKAPAPAAPAKAAKVKSAKKGKK